MPRMVGTEDMTLLESVGEYIKVREAPKVDSEGRPDTQAVVAEFRAFNDLKEKYYQYASDTNTIDQSLPTG